MIGDEFVARSGHTIENDDENYSNLNFQVRASGGSAVSSNNPDGLSRTRNTFVKMLRKYHNLPKILVIDKRK